MTAKWPQMQNLLAYYFKNNSYLSRFSVWLFLLPTNLCYGFSLNVNDRPHIQLCLLNVISTWRHSLVAPSSQHANLLLIQYIILKLRCMKNLANHFVKQLVKYLNINISYVPLPHLLPISNFLIAKICWDFFTAVNLSSVFTSCGMFLNSHLF